MVKWEDFRKEWLTLEEYGALKKRNPANLRQKILRGTIKAKKAGNQWFIRKDEPLKDHRKAKN